MSTIDRLLRPHEHALSVRVLRSSVAIGGYDRALALSSQAFGALVPAMLVGSSLGPTGSGAALASGLGLSGRAANTLSELVERPAQSDPSLTALGVALLVMSVFGFIRSLQRTYTAAWDLPPSGVRGFGRGLLVSAALVGALAVLTLLAPVTGQLLDSAVIGLAVQAATSLLLWWPIQRVLLGGRVSWRDLLPGAVLTGLGQAVLVTASSIYIPIAVARSAERLGILGVAAVLLSWLVALGLLLVVSAVLGAELARHQSPGADEAARTELGHRRGGPDQRGTSMRYEFSVASRLSDTAAAAFPELDRAEGPAGRTHLFGHIRDADHLGSVVARFGDLGLDVIDVHRLPD